MTFQEAIMTIVASSTRNAARRPAWGGYVKRSTVDAGTGGYTLTFKERSGTETTYTFSGTTWTEPGTALSIDAELLASILADDWSIGTSADFENSRSGDGKW